MDALDSGSTDYIEDEQEILRLAEALRKKGRDPVKILKFHIQANEKMEQAVTLGKEATAFLQKQWDAFEKEFSKKRNK